MHVAGVRFRGRPALDHLFSPPLAVLLFSLVACGGSTTTGPGNDGSDAGQTSDSRATSDTGTTDDTGVTSDAGSTADAGRPECDARLVTCKSLPPPCASGEVPVVAGNCWAGHCVKPSLCRSVQNCAVCNATSDVCATDIARTGPTVRCVEVPSACSSVRTCRCLASYICTTPYDTCSETANMNELTCSCPAC